MLRRWRPSWAQIHINIRGNQRKRKSKSSLYDYCYGIVSQYTIFDILLLLFRKPLRFFVVLNQQLVLRICITLTFFFLPFSFFFFSFLSFLSLFFWRPKQKSQRIFSYQSTIKPDENNAPSQNEIFWWSLIDHDH